jgi:hypothetical protein
MPRYVHDEPKVVDATSLQFKAQKLVPGSAQHCTEAGATDVVHGILQEGVVAADIGKRAVAIRTLGVSRCIASEAIAIGARVVAAASGQIRNALGATAKQNQVGIAVTAAAASGDHFDVELTPGVQIDT